jgi:eukaryotic-like serine/threonine-protein kinase
MQEISKGLSLEPTHRLLRASLGYLYFRMGETKRAITTLEEVRADDPNLTLASPTLAMCYVADGQIARAEELITEQAMSAAEADAEMSYRLATYFAVAKDSSEAFHWLRRATYLGYENYPWLVSNPAWLGLRKDALFRTLIAEQKKAYARNRKIWEKLLSVSVPGPA